MSLFTTTVIIFADTNISGAERNVPATIPVATCTSVQSFWLAFRPESHAQSCPVLYYTYRNILYKLYILHVIVMNV